MSWPTWICAGAPLGMLLIFLSLALRVRLKLGHWPVPMHDDVDLGSWTWKLHEFVLYAWVGLSVFVAGPAGLILLFFERFRGSLGFHLFQLGVFLLGWALVGLWCRTDPWQLLNWLSD